MRFKLHLSEPRHINHFRSMAYREPRKRQMWLKIWFSEVEKAEAAKGGEAFDLVDEEEEDGYVEEEEEEEETKAVAGGRRGSIFGAGIRWASLHDTKCGVLQHTMTWHCKKASF